MTRLQISMRENYLKILMDIRKFVLSTVNCNKHFTLNIQSTCYTRGMEFYNSLLNAKKRKSLQSSNEFFPFEGNKIE